MKSSIRAVIALFCLTTFVSAADYFPLAVENVWTYLVQGLGEMEIKIDQKIPVGGDTFFRTQVKVSLAGISDSVTGYMVSRGNDVLAADSLTSAPPYEKGFEHQPVAGHAWDYSDGGTTKIVFYGTCTVAAGTYSNCYATVDGEDTMAIYAPDVGMIATLYAGELELELVSYHGSSSSVRYNPEIIARRSSSPATGAHPELFSVVNIMGRRVAKATAGASLRTLSPGTYVAIDKKVSPSGLQRAQKWCVFGR